jgi:hypothetical protein
MIANMHQGQGHQ